MKRLLGFLCVVLVPGIVAAETIYVDADAPPNGDGSSWERAFTDLQDALIRSEEGEFDDEIRVAGGTYKPTGPNGAREAAFRLLNGVALRGGYAGFGEPDPDERDIVLHKTILSGDLNGNDNPDFENNDENTCNVVVAFGNDETAVLDGFVIEGGNADRWPQIGGGGIFSSGGSPTIIDCTLTGNYASNGGGMADWNGGSSTLISCRFVVNMTDGQGGGMSTSTGSHPTLLNCEFIGNSTTSDSHGGGGMSNIKEASPTLVNCIFAGNMALDSSGGGIHNWGGANATVTDCVFVENVAFRGGGFRTGFSDPTLTDCIFIANRAVAAGGVYSDGRGSPALANCIIVENVAEHHGGGILSDRGSSPVLTNCTLVKNSADLGGGMYTVKGNPTLANCILWENSDSEGRGESSQIYIEDSAVDINYSCVQGWTGELGGEGNIGDDPRFIDLDNDNVRLQSGSPAVDTGDNSVVTAEKDLDGNPRIINKVVDMGAYESVCPTIRRLKVKCSGGRLKAKLKTRLPGGSVVMLTNEGGAVRTVYLEPNGKGVAKWKRQTGQHEICASGCSDVCKSADCL